MFFYALFLAILVASVIHLCFKPFLIHPETRVMREYTGHSATNKQNSNTTYVIVNQL